MRESDEKFNRQTPVAPPRPQAFDRESDRITGHVHSIETLGALDGPGLRYVLFMQGCPFRCGYCHNPDTWEMNAGYEITVREQFEDILRYRNYLSGGVTISGGEPLAQPGFVAALLEKCHENDIHVAIDTSGGMPMSGIESVVCEADLILLDIKLFDRKKAIDLCGIDTDNAWALLNYRQSIGKPVWIRHVLVPGRTLFEKDGEGNLITDRDEFFKQNHELVLGIRRLKSYSCVERIDLLPFHKMGEHKWEELGLAYALSDIDEPAEHVIAWCQTLI
ncbi:MAG: pyruvate formate lyase-activating protein [Clostridiales bacterium]|nr:pyruvate formate lyase-activating protein [Clostridiales bacterium]